MVWGEGRNLGMPVRWCLRHDGASFVEEAVGPELSYVSGHSSDAPDVWETDFSGYTQSLQLDDREAALLASWVRTNWWAHPDAGDALELTLGRCTDAERADATVEHDEAVVCARVRDGESSSPGSSSRRASGPDAHDGSRLRRRGALGVPTLERAHAERYRASDRPCRWCRRCRWCVPGARVSRKTTLTGASGGKQEFRVGGVRANAGASAAFFRTPAPPMDTPGRHPDRVSSTPSRANRGGVTFDSRLPPEVCVERARSSHVLVRPEIDGVDVGPFILDTGASGLVITGRAAETLGLRAFGEVFVSGVAGKVPCRFRRAGSLTLGPVTVDAPVFMEMDVGGIVSARPNPSRASSASTRSNHPCWRLDREGPVRLYDPATFVAPAAWRWRSLLMVSNVPHVAADFAGAPNGEARVFMIDSGAGVPTASSTRARRRRTRPATVTPTRGRRRREVIVARAGRRRKRRREQRATRAYRGKLEWLRLRETGESGNGSGTGEETSTESSTSTSTSSSTSTSTSSSTSTSASSSTSTSTSSSTPKLDGGLFENLSVLLAADAGFDLSEHSCGLICANALNSRRVVYDVPNRRVALLVDGVDPKPCEGVLCESVEWEEEKATRRAERRKKREAFFPSPEEWRGFLDCVEFGNDQ